MRLVPDIFLRAAEKQHAWMLHRTDSDEKVEVGTFNYYSCDNLLYSTAEYNGAIDRREWIEINLYERIFSPRWDEQVRPDCEDSCAWWPNVNGRWDHESRILALLLAGEIAEDLNEQFPDITNEIILHLGSSQAA